MFNSYGERKESYIMFKCEHGDGNTITMKMPAQISWPEAMDNFKNFLKGVGYIIPEEGCICNNPIKEDDYESKWEVSQCDDEDEEELNLTVTAERDETVEITVTDGVPT